MQRPAVRFLELRAWAVLRATPPGLFKSDLYVALLETFTAQGITIPFPQRDLHMKTAVQLENGRPADAGASTDDDGSSRRHAGRARIARVSVAYA